MASINDVFNELTEVNNRLQTVHNDLVNVTTATNLVRDSVDDVRDAVNNVLQSVNLVVSNTHTLVMLDVYATQALFHISQQNDTMICLLEQIARNTCGTLNEVHVQTGLQESMQRNGTALREMYKTTHPDAALALERDEALKRKIESCCPPEEPRPVCVYQRCDMPDRLSEPPEVKVDRDQPIG